MTTPRITSLRPSLARPLLWASAASLSALACSGTAQDAVTPPATATPAATATSAPVVTATPGATAAPTAAAEPPPAVSKLVAVASLPGPSMVFPVEGGLVLARDETAEVKPQGAWGVQIGIVKGDEADFSQGLLLDGMHRVVHIGGALPDAVDVLAIGDTGRTGIAEHYVLKGKALSASSAKVGLFHTGVARVGGSVLSLQAPMFSFSDVPKVATVRGPALSYKLQAADKKCETQRAVVFPYAFGVTGDGAVVSYGSTCDDKAATEVWAAAGKPSVIVPIPGAEVDREARLVTGKGKDLWLLSQTVQRFDGTTWTAIDPPPGYANEGAVAPDGTLWAVTSSGSVIAWRNDEWHLEMLPDGAAANHIAITNDGVVWVTTATALLRTRRPDDGAGVKLDAKDKAPPPKKKRLLPGSPRCTQNVVVLYGFTKVTPDDYDFPLTRKAIKGHKEYSKTRFVVTKDGGQKFFTAMVPDFDTGKKLVQLIEKEVQGSKPQVVCAEPEIVREVKIDLATGDVIK